MSDIGLRGLRGRVLASGHGLYRRLDSSVCRPRLYSGAVSVLSFGDLLNGDSVP